MRDGIALLAPQCSAAMVTSTKERILDVTADSATLGKTAGKDAEARKLTYPGLYGVDESRARLAAVAEEARGLAVQLPRGGGLFPSLIEYLSSRSN